MRPRLLTWWLAFFVAFCMCRRLSNSSQPKEQGNGSGRHEPRINYGDQALTAPGRRSFVIDYDENVFLKDGKPFRYIAGAMHYFRVPRAFWKDRLLKYKAGGLNAVDTCVEWSGHEPEPGSFNFKGDYDLLGFLRTAQELGLLVILRPGPYIGAERDNGGLPYWLLRLNGEMKLRSSDKSYLKEVDRWLGVLLPMVRPFLYGNGGPIIMVQVESHYGWSAACDKEYMLHLVSVFKAHLGNGVLLFTTDTAGRGFLRCGTVEGVLATVDCTARQDVKDAFSFARTANKDKGPLAVNEFYTGWWDKWGRRHFVVADTTSKTLRDILDWNASVIFHMYHGGTNFGFSNGATQRPITTSYDFAAPISEAGDPTELYYQLHKILSRYETLPPVKRIKPSPKLNYGEVKLSCGPSLQDVMDHFRKRNMLKNATADRPMSFEDLGQDYGYVAYSTVAPFECNGTCYFRIYWYRDRAYVISGNVTSIDDATSAARYLMIQTSKGRPLTIFVENTGRPSDGGMLGKKKGILSFVALNGEPLGPWTMEAVPITKAKDIEELHDFIYRTGPVQNCGGHRFYFGRFVLSKGQELLDTFLDPTGWTKGVAFINGFNLGRYWPVVGPQVTLYVPRTVLRPYPEENRVVLLEMEGVDDHRSVKLTDTPNLNGKTSA